MRIHCVGIAGSGMLPLAVYLRTQGHTVTGSDRFLDTGVTSPRFQLLEAHGIALFPQDGSGVTAATDRVIHSAAVEPTVPDLAAARERGIETLARPAALAEVFNRSRGIGVAGSSGKSTTAGMIGFLLTEAGLAPSMINGAAVLNYADRPEGGSFLAGDSDILCIEADESDGSVTGYHAHTAVILNISRDHRELPELKTLFTTFARQAAQILWNRGCPHLLETAIPELPQARTFGLETAADFTVTEITLEGCTASFRINGVPFRLALPGRHNIENAAAAAAACTGYGLALEQAAEILPRFRGLERRMNVIGTHNGITVLDDYAHNPAKVTAALCAARTFGRRIVALYQPHGFGPTAFIRDELISACAAMLGAEDELYFAEIFYAGGSAARTITAADLACQAQTAGINARTVSRADAAAALAAAARPGDAVIIMGARDITLGQLAREVFGKIERT